MSKRPTQKDRVVEYIKEFGSITSYEAFLDLGVTRLSAVIFDLKKLGYEIESTPVHSTNRFGEKTTFARYSFYKGED